MPRVCYFTGKKTSVGWIRAEKGARRDGGVGNKIKGRTKRQVKPNLKKITEYVDRSLMLVTALAPVIGYDKASQIAHHAMDHDLTLKAAALQLGFVSEAEFDRVVDPKKMVTPYVATD